MFSWSSTRRRSGVPSSTYPGERTSVATTIPDSIRPPSYSRQQHLDSYLNDDTLKRSTRKVSADDSTYDTVFATASGVVLILRVHVPLANPYCRPSMSLAGVVARHAWLDGSRIVGFGAINSDEQWKQAHTLLGAAVHQVVQHLQMHPPEMVEFTDAGLRNIQPKDRKSSSHQTHQTVNPHVTRSANTSSDAPPDYETVANDVIPLPDLPTIPSDFEELQDLDRDQLEELLNDELAFVAFCNQLPISETIGSNASSVLEDNVELAQANLEKREELETLHKNVKELHEKLQERVAAFEVLQAKQTKLCAPPDTRRLRHDLIKAKKEAFDKSEELADEWLDEGGSVDDFVKAFQEERRVHHVRAAKLELLEHHKTV